MHGCGPREAQRSCRAGHQRCSSVSCGWHVPQYLTATAGRNCHCHFEGEQAEAEGSGTPRSRSRSKSAVRLLQLGQAFLKPLLPPLSAMLPRIPHPGRRHRWACSSVLASLSSSQADSLWPGFLLHPGFTFFLGKERAAFGAGSAKAPWQSKHSPSCSSPLGGLDPCSALMGVGGQL